MTSGSLHGCLIVFCKKCCFLLRAISLYNPFCPHSFVRLCLSLPDWLRKERYFLKEVIKVDELDEANINVTVGK